MKRGKKEKAIKTAILSYCGIVGIITISTVHSSLKLGILERLIIYMVYALIVTYEIFNLNNIMKVKADKSQRKIIKILEAKYFFELNFITVLILSICKFVTQRNPLILAIVGIIVGTITVILELNVINYLPQYYKMIKKEDKRDEIEETIKFP